MKESARIHAAYGETRKRIDTLNAEAGANRPIRHNYRLTSAEQRENERRHARMEQLDSEIAQANAEATRLQKAYAAAIEAERSQTAPPDGEMVIALTARRAELENTLATAHNDRAAVALAASAGDAEAVKHRNKAITAERTATVELENTDLAIAAARTAEAEERLEFAEREADKRHAAAIAVGEQMTVTAAKIDGAMRDLASLFNEFNGLARSMSKTGAALDHGRLRPLLTVDARHRAAKSADLAAHLGVAIFGHSASFEDATRSLLRLAIKRPDPKEIAA